MAIGIDASNKSFGGTEFYDLDCRSPNRSIFYAYYSYAGASDVSPCIFSTQNEIDNDNTTYKSINGSYSCIYSHDNNRVKMELNMNDKTLKFYVNDKDQGIGVKKINFENDEKYTMCICSDGMIKMQLADCQHMLL